ncbi:beta-1,4-mannosyl-glycoprotein 4-beta-N-acetylglucosaminyltransferase-like [Macrobrachium nipponense]|uniref:beta-1,4-mannosyl-glycoprotein 4-beta-N-acetylglucosaminyltransferase-like n=1 Tax=Macrobrachium nipponense TaxID=159736 RepID=UPI0030C85804
MISGLVLDFEILSWRWAQTEWRRRRKLTECIVILVMAQVVVLLCVIMPQHLEKKRQELIIEEQRRVGKYIVLFTTTEGGILGQESHGERTRPNGQTSLQTTQSGNASHSHWVNTEKKTVRQDVTADGEERRDDLAYSNDPVDISAISEPFPTVDLNRSHGGTGVDEGEFYEDPVLGRGFQDEFVTHKSDGNGFLFYGQSDFNSSPETFNRVLESVSVGLTSDKTDSLVKLDDSADKKVNKRHALGNVSSNVLNITDETQFYKYKDYDINHINEFVLKNDEKTYFTKIDGKECFIRGTDIEETIVSKGKACSCLQYYFGDDCGIPEAVWFGQSSRLTGEVKLTRRKIPRRVINGLPVNHEFAMFEARMHELSDVVDAFLIVESNYTSHGDPKELSFLKKFQSGYLAQFQEKIHYVKLLFFSNESRSNGWRADSYLRFYMGSKGLKQMKGLREDDLFILSDADELPTREVVTFLKLYDGFPEPVGFGLRWNVFGFFWQVPADMTFINWLSGTKMKLLVVYSAATIGMVQRVLLNNVFYIRKERAWEHPQLADSLGYYRKAGHLVKDWVVGSVDHYAGWHCSWCFSPTGIVQKMDSAQANDKPRWGDYPEKKNISYVMSRIWKGRWFDDQASYLPVKDTQERFYAPSYLLEHPESYRSLLYHPGHPLNRNRTWQPP